MSIRLTYSEFRLQYGSTLDGIYIESQPAYRGLVRSDWGRAVMSSWQWLGSDKDLRQYILETEQSLVIMDIECHPDERVIHKLVDLPTELEEHKLSIYTSPLDHLILPKSATWIALDCGSNNYAVVSGSPSFFDNYVAHLGGLDRIRQDFLQELDRPESWFPKGQWRADLRKWIGW